MRYKSDFAILDVKRGRATLRNLVKNHTKKIPVTIEGFITSDWSRDDNVSVEFQVDVTKLTTGVPVAQECNCIRCMARARVKLVKALKHQRT